MKMEVEHVRKVCLTDFLVDTFPEAFVRNAENPNGFQYIEGRYVSVNGKNIRLCRRISMRIPSTF